MGNYRDIAPWCSSIRYYHQPVKTSLFARSSPVSGKLWGRDVDEYASELRSSHSERDGNATCIVAISRCQTLPPHPTDRKVLCCGQSSTTSIGICLGRGPTAEPYLPFTPSNSLADLQVGMISAGGPFGEALSHLVCISSAPAS